MLTQHDSYVLNTIHECIDEFMEIDPLKLNYYEKDNLETLGDMRDQIRNGLSLSDSQEELLNAIWDGIFCPY